MPTPEEIQNIASELWRSKDPFISMDKEHPIEYKIEELKEVIEILLRDYCIVPKSKARELRQIVTDNVDSLDHGLIDGLSDWVEINLGSQLFEEEKL